MSTSKTEYYHTTTRIEINGNGKEKPSPTVKQFVQPTQPTASNSSPDSPTVPSSKSSTTIPVNVQTPRESQNNSNRGSAAFGHQTPIIDEEDNAPFESTLFSDERLQFKPRTSTILRCSDLKTTDTPTYKRNSRLIPSGMPRNMTNFSMQVLDTECCVTATLDPRVDLNSVRVTCDPKQEFIILSYERSVDLDQIGNQSLQRRLSSMSEDSLANGGAGAPRHLTTFIEHRLKVDTKSYHIRLTRVKQKLGVVYLIVPKKSKV